MGRLILAAILLLLVLSGLGFYYVYQQSKKIAEFESLRPEDEEPLEFEEQIQYVDDCEQALIDSGRDYVICSLDSNGNLYLTNDKRVFSPGEYVGLQVNLQRLNDYFDSYYVCAYSNFPKYQAPIPDKYDGSTILVNTSKKNGIEYERWVCSTLFHQEYFHHMGISCYVPTVPGKFTLARMFLFSSELGYRTKEDFLDHLDESVVVFDMEGEIR